MTLATDRRLMILLENERACAKHAKLMRLQADPTVKYRQEIANALRETLQSNIPHRYYSPENLENAVRRISLPEGVTFTEVAVTQSPVDPEAYVLEVTIQPPRPLEYVTMNMELTAVEDDE